MAVVHFLLWVDEACYNVLKCSSILILYVVINVMFQFKKKLLLEGK